MSLAVCHGMNQTAYSNYTGLVSPEQGEMGPQMKSPAFVLGEQIANIVEYIFSRMPSFSFPGAMASPVTDRRELLGILDHRLKNLFAEVLREVESSKGIDIALVIDNKAKMEPHMESVKKHVIQFVDRMEELKDGNKRRIAVMEYPYKDDLAPHPVGIQLRSDFSLVKAMVGIIDPHGENRTPKKESEMLEELKSRLNWDKESKCLVVVISDKPEKETLIGSLWNTISALYFPFNFIVNGRFS